MTSLLSPPGSLTSRQRALAWITALFVVLTRLYALARTPWDWDEIQFSLGAHEFNSGLVHHPHPPGFPVYMLAAKIARLFAASDFGACQAIVFLSACALFPLAFFLARELRFSFATSYSGALLFVFLPNIWFYGGTAFSDIPGVAVLLAAAMMLLRGCHNPRAFLIGAVLLGLAAGVRPQAVFMGCGPFLVASWCRFLDRRSLLRIVAAGLLVIATTGACYAGAALASDSIASYRAGLAFAREWNHQHDIWFSPGRPSLTTLLERVFVRPIFDGNRLTLVLSALAGAGLIAGFFRARMSVWLAMAIFFPFVLVAWLMLDYHSIHRYSTGYAFLWAILPAHAIGVLAIPLRRFAALAQIAIVAVLAASCAWWTLPALRDVRGSVSPPVAALAWARMHVPPANTIWIDDSLRPYAEYFLADRKVGVVKDRTRLPPGRTGDVFLAEGFEPGASASFRRLRGRAWNVARQRYFEASVVPLPNLWAFGDGWHEQESDGELVWRWMGLRSEALLQPLPGGRARLAMTLAGAGTPEIEVRLNDALLERFHLTPQRRQKEWVVDARSDAPNRLVIVSSEAVNPAKQGQSDDARDLSAQLTALSWQPVR